MKVSIEPKKFAKYTLGRACLRDFNLNSWNTAINLPPIARKGQLMDISISKAKNTQNPKSLQSIGQRKLIKKLKNLEMKIWETKFQNLLREKQGIHQQLSDPTPSSLPLQGGRGFSRSSSKLSSLEGVWQPRKGENEEREERKL